jgi:hypothetical protein
VPAVVELQSLSREQAPAPPPSPAVELDPQCFEALRLGVVPPHGLLALTVGREAELARIQALLSEEAGLLLVSGHYGHGKSHLLETASELALEQGYAVARCAFNPLEQPPSHPLRLYRALMADLRWPGRESRGLRPLVEQLEQRPVPTHRWLSPLRHAALHAPDLLDELVDFAEGRGGEAAELSRRLRRCGYRGEALLALPDYRTFGQIMAHLLGGVACWARAAGHRGLVLALDEAECVERLDAEARALAEEVLCWLALACLPEGAVPFEESALYRGGRPVHRLVEARYHAVQPLIALCAFTPHPALDTLLEGFSPAGARWTLSPLSPAALCALIGPLGEQHQRCFRHRVEADVQRAVEERLRRAVAEGHLSSPRELARAVVESWDMLAAEPVQAMRSLGIG